MKPLLLLLCLALPNPVQPKLGISTEYDKFTDTTTIRNSQSIMPVRPGYVLFDVAASIKGKYGQGAPPHEVAIIIESHSDEWVFLGQPTVLRVFRNDSERYPLGTMRRITGRVVGRGVIEALYLRVELEDIERLASADKLEIQVGPLESEIKPEQRASLKDWLALFRTR